LSRVRPSSKGATFPVWLSHEGVAGVLRAVRRPAMGPMPL
jgi:hypothetical protein